MSQMTKCDEGHFYDKEQNSKCPFCGVGPVDLTKKYVDDGADSTVKYSESEADDKTRRYASRDAKPGKGRGRGTPDPDATIAVWSKGGGIDPVVGWLVCHQGPNQGRDYRIRSGYNNIGRDTSSQICIAGDDTIGRIEHAKIFYDLKNASFHLIAGSGRSGAYVNEQVVLQSTPLEAYDILEIGATKLVFVPFCGDRFRWDTSGSNDSKVGTAKGPTPPERPAGPEVDDDERTLG